MFFRLPILNPEGPEPTPQWRRRRRTVFNQGECTGGAAAPTAIEVVMMELVALALLGAMILGEALILWNFIRLFE